MRQDLTGKDVVVLAAGVTYEGRLIEMTESYILLRSVTGHRQIQMEQVIRIEDKGAERSSSSFATPSPLSRFSK